MPVDMRAPKSEAARWLPAGSAARDTLEVQPDRLGEGAFDAMVPTWIKLLRRREI